MLFFAATARLSGIRTNANLFLLVLQRNQGDLYTESGQIDLKSRTSTGRPLRFPRVIAEKLSVIARHLTSSKAGEFDAQLRDRRKLVCGRHKMLVRGQPKFRPSTERQTWQWEIVYISANHVGNCRLDVDSFFSENEKPNIFHKIAKNRFKDIKKI